MTGIPAWILVNWWLFVIALVFVILLIVGVSWAVCWYFWRYVIQLERERKRFPTAGETWGDSTHLPDDYWRMVEHEEAKRHVA